MCTRVEHNNNNNIKMSIVVLSRVAPTLLQILSCRVSLVTLQALLAGPLATKRLHEAEVGTPEDF